MNLRLRGLFGQARWGWVPCFVTAACLLFTGFSTVYVRRYSEAADRVRWQKLVQHTSDSISHSIDVYVALLQGASGLFALQPEVTRETFQAYVEPLRLRERYGGIQGVGYTVRVSSAEKEAYVHRMRRAGLVRFVPGQGDVPFEIWSLGRDVRRDEYHSIIFLEPLDLRNRAAIGLDMFTEAVRQEAMARARDSGQPAASGRVTLVQEIDEQKQPGFLIYVPVYKGGRTPPTVALRRELLLGFVYSPFRVRDLLDNVAGPAEHEGLDFVVYDGREAPSAQKLYASGVADHGAEYKPRLIDTETIGVAGRPWTVQFAAHPSFDAGSTRTYVLPTAAAGFLITGVLFWVTLALTRAHARAESVAEELLKSQQATSEARHQAEAATRMKDEFLAIVSHELRTPLNAILGWSHLLHQGKLGTAETARGLNIIERNARVQAQLIGDLLDISRIVSGKLRLEMQDVDLLLVVETAFETVAPAAAEKGVRLQKHLEQVGAVHGDPGRLQQIAWNLLSNAIKFTPSGGLVTVTLARSNGIAELRVGDTGAGISSDVLPYIFDRFRQGHPALTRKHGGLGLGLAIVRSLTDAHGGTVHVESAGEGRGSEFRVVFPVHRPMRRQGEADGCSPPESPALLEGVRVLVVEDEVEARELVSLALEKAGASVRDCDSAEQAMRELQKFTPDVLVSDIGMAGEDGYSLLRRIRSSGSSVPAIALTAFAREEDRTRAFKAGFQEHMSKPVETELLIAMVARLGGRIGFAADNRV